MNIKNYEFRDEQSISWDGNPAFWFEYAQTENNSWIHKMFLYMLLRNEKSLTVTTENMRILTVMSMSMASGQAFKRINGIKC